MQRLQAGVGRVRNAGEDGVEPTGDPQERLHHVWAGAGRDLDLTDDGKQLGTKKIISLVGMLAKVNTEPGPPPELPGVGKQIPPKPAGIRINQK